MLHTAIYVQIFFTQKCYVSCTSYKYKQIHNQQLLLCTLSYLGHCTGCSIYILNSVSTVAKLIRGLSQEDQMAVLVDTDLGQVEQQLIYPH